MLITLVFVAPAGISIYYGKSIIQTNVPFKKVRLIKLAQPLKPIS
jgi:hypothetical protein